MGFKDDGNKIKGRETEVVGIVVVVVVVGVIILLCKVRVDHHWLLVRTNQYPTTIIISALPCPASTLIVPELTLEIVLLLLEQFIIFTLLATFSPARFASLDVLLGEFPIQTGASLVASNILHSSTTP